MEAAREQGTEAEEQAAEDVVVAAMQVECMAEARAEIAEAVQVMG